MCAPQIYSSMAIILILMYQDGTICPAQVLSTASALRPLERDGGPNCAAGLVLVLSVDTVPRLDTGYYNRVQAGTALATA